MKILSAALSLLLAWRTVLAVAQTATAVIATPANEAANQRVQRRAGKCGLMLPRS